ncbi:imidazole glycerol phosphate synthase subunit HisH [Colwellia sp. 12G3]|uniref:imidazole glycerol phosphate synthase subunit HisH n=1 Tax=Colwellia sp. 12G3 TaxID=2058299 RepID=UPI000C31D693|nr:imidazole glycerol phosphate synthase subunit HisH [Colwellia sp. 12G3]PKI18146.1 imidazole glycerol phosphate synthase subunit HisH [Colwellia sp. 12G3]
MTNSTSTAMNVIVDTGCANLASVKFAVERLGYQVTITDDVALIQSADKVILPGVGTAKHAMANIKAKNLVSVLQNLTQPVLGFCLGMQLMTESSTEGKKSSTESSSENNTSNIVPCLNLIPTKVEPLQAQGNRLPHMGWNTLTQVSDHPVFKGITAGDYFYFVHSFAAPISEYTIASCEYGSSFSAAIAKDNFIGCQFHPERSSALGSKIIQNFLELDFTEVKQEQTKL